MRTRGIRGCSNISSIIEYEILHEADTYFGSDSKVVGSRTYNAIKYYLETYHSESLIISMLSVYPLPGGHEVRLTADITQQKYRTWVVLDVRLLFTSNQTRGTCHVTAGSAYESCRQLTEKVVWQTVFCECFCKDDKISTLVHCQFR